MRAPLATFGFLLGLAPAWAADGDGAPARAAAAWVEGDLDAALEALQEQPAGAARDLNRAVVLLHAGSLAEAEAELGRLSERQPGWAPALRWLARAQREAGRPEALDTAGRLLALPGAGPRDRLWLAQLLLERGRPEPAHAELHRVLAADADLPLAWQGLARAERALGREREALQAEQRAGPLADEAPAPSAAFPLRAGERLRLSVRYLFFRLATLTLETGPELLHAGRPAHRVVLRVRSNPSLFFFRIDSRFESVVAEDGSVLAHRHRSSDSDSEDELAGYDMDREAGRCTVRTVRAGLFGFEQLPLPPGAQDGLSVLQAARAAALGGAPVSLPTAVDGTWRLTRLQPAGRTRLRCRSAEVEAARVQLLAGYRGPAGLSGTIDLWISADGRAVPCRARLKAAVGSVTLELLPDEPPEPASP